MWEPAPCLADQTQARQLLEQLPVDRRPLADQDDGLRLADLSRALGRVERPMGVHNDLVPGDSTKTRKPLDDLLVVLHDNDPHPATISQNGDPRCRDPA